MSTLTITLIMSAVSGLLLGLGCIRPLRTVCGVLCYVWLIAALPILYFANVPSMQVLLFYLLSALIGLAVNFGGKRA